jgi:TRAP-type C4-dicarboxylate transport system substrate-binding protein
MTTNRRTLLGAAGAAMMLALGATSALAQDVTLKLHQMLPAQAAVPKLILDVWADKVEADSGGRIKIDRYPAMQLGGAPPELVDQAIDGVADICRSLSLIRWPLPMLIGRCTKMACRTSLKVCICWAPGSTGRA